MAEEVTALRDRQGKPEGRVTVLEATVEREAAPRAKVDEDQSNITATLRAHTLSLQALHDTQQDHTRRLTRIDDRLGNVEVSLGNVENDLVTVKEKLGAVHIGVHGILDLLGTHLARRPRRLSLAGLLRRAPQ